MRITTWNINGLRAVINKDGFGWIPEMGADVLCFQEIKAKPEQVTEDQLAPFDGYTVHWNPAERPGYSGVATLVKNDPLDVVHGLGIEQFDIEGRVIRTRHENFLLYNIYFPNGQRDQGRLDYKLDFYAALLEECDQFHAAGENIIITGDFNTSHNEIDLARPKGNEKTSGFMPEERAWIDKYLEHGFVDPFRVMYPDKVQYTWWTYISNARARNVGWRLDYYLVSESLMGQVKDTVIHDDIMGSDHCPVSLILK